MKRVILLVAGTVLLMGGEMTGEASAQSRRSDTVRAADTLNLIQRYRSARYRTLTQRFLRTEAPLRVLPTETEGLPLDSRWRSSSSDHQSPSAQADSFAIHDVRLVQPLERTWFQNKHAATNWSFLGAGTYLTFFDTTRTRELRARLQSHFGEPTQTIADLGRDSARSGVPQFQYWFIVNDSIPVRVTDADGPRGRGLIVSTERQLRDRLLPLRNALLRPLREARRAPYVDFYYDEPAQRWYRTGFDGTTYFLEPVSRFDVVRGRRPRLDTTRTDSSTALGKEEAPSP